MGNRSWQPIENAPKDGTKVDLFVRGFTLTGDPVGKRFPDAYWHTGEPAGPNGGSPRIGWWIGSYPLAKKWRPTHWMIQPEAPS
jgi:hypothetical protein